MSGGIFPFAINTPFSVPQAMPVTAATRIPTMATPHPSPPIFSMTFAPTTEEKTSTEPIDRSIPR